RAWRLSRLCLVDGAGTKTARGAEPHTTMAAAGGSRDDPGMDPLSLVPALASPDVVPVAPGLAFCSLAGDEADDAISPLSALLMTETQTRPVRGAQDADFVPWR